MTEQSAAPPLPPGRYVDLPGRGTTFIREVPGPAGGTRARPAPRVDRHGRHQLVPILRGPRSALPCDRPRPPRTRARAVVAGTVPPSRLRRRRGGAGGRAGHRQCDPGRLLDGRARRAARLAPPPGARPGPGPVRDGQAVRQQPRRAADVLRHGCVGPGVTPKPGHAARPPLGRLPRPAGAPVRRLGDGAGQPAQLDQDPGSRTSHRTVLVPRMGGRHRRAGGGGDHHGRSRGAAPAPDPALRVDPGRPRPSGWTETTTPA